MLEKYVYNLMSSANNLAVADWSIWSVTSFTSRLNSYEPRTLPWGTPLVTRQGVDRYES